MAVLTWAVTALVAYVVFKYFRGLQRNIALAKNSGFPYVVTPVYHVSIIWLLQSWIWIPLLRKLPTSWTSPWLDYLDNEWPWQLKRKPFDNTEADMLMIVTPTTNSLIVANPEAISQISTRRNDFPKPIHIYKSVDIYGKNVVSTEGSVWRQHRKITSPPFTERNNQVVWTESLHQAKAMVAEWIKPGKTSSGTVLDTAAATMRLSLYVISKAGFGVRLTWPHEEDGKGDELRNGHTLSYKDALQHLLENIVQTFLLPQVVLRNSPLKMNQLAYESMHEWKRYMQEMYDGKKAALVRGEKVDGMDLMGALVKGAGIVPDPALADAEKGDAALFPPKQLLTDGEILGNAFVFILAGHETAANTLHFAFLYLAMNPASQRRLQSDLDGIFGSRTPEQWSYDEDVPKLFGSMAGAVMNEELRLVPPVNSIPKQVAPESAPQPLTIGGKRYVCPPATQIGLNTIAAHLNPKVWPALVPPGSSREAIAEDLLRFRPERWLLHGNEHISIDGKPVPSNSSGSAAAGADADDKEAAADVGGPQNPDTSASLFRPPRGAYVPFSEGARACLGRRFAQVEVLAVLAVLFREYSVELAVEAINDSPHWPFKEKGSPADDEALLADVRRAEQQQRAPGRDDWACARDKVLALLDTNMRTIITIQLRGARVPLRFVRRGSERFDFDA